MLEIRGFRMEDTHLTDGDKIERLIFVLTIAFCWCYRAGEIKAQTEPIVLKTHGRKARSLFMEGLNRIRRVLLLVTSALKDFRRLLICFNGLKTGGYTT